MNQGVQLLQEVERFLLLLRCHILIFVGMTDEIQGDLIVELALHHHPCDYADEEDDEQAINGR